MTSNGSSHVGPIKERRLSFHRIRHPDGPYTSLTRKHIGLSTSQLLLGHRHFNHRSSPPQARAQDKTIDFRLSHSQRPIAEARLPRLELKTGLPTSAHPTSTNISAHPTSTRIPPSSSSPPPASIPIPSQLHNGSIHHHSRLLNHLIATERWTQEQCKRTH